MHTEDIPSYASVIVPSLSFAYFYYLHCFQACSNHYLSSFPDFHLQFNISSPLFLSHGTGAKLDTLIMLIVTSTVIPVFKRLNLSPILGFLLMGTVLGPSCLHMIHDVHTIDMLGRYKHKGFLVCQIPH